MAYTLDFGLALGSSKTGLTLNAQLVDTAGTNSGSAISTGFAEIGTGYYLWHYAAFADGFRGGVKFYESGVPATILAFAAINPEEAEYVDAAVSSRSDFDESADSVTLTAAGIQAIFNATLTEGYAADGSAFTLAQAFYEIAQFHNERNISATTITVKKRDGSTTAYTLTYDADSITRAT